MTRESLRPSAKKPKLKLAKLTTAPFTAWSLSRLKLYEKCPLQARLKHVEKLPETPNAAMARGDRIHKALEAYVKTGGKVPMDLHAGLHDNIKWLRGQYTKRNANAEAELAFDRDWKPVSWFSKDTYVRIKADALYLPKKAADTMKVIDYKTGQIREGEYDDTLELYGMSGLVAGAGATANGELWFTDHGVVVPAKKIMTLKDLPKLLKKWDDRVKPMLNDKRFAPRPGDHCRWCTWSNAKNGPCEY